MTGLRSAGRIGAARKRLAAGVVLALLILAVAGWVSYRNTTRLIENGHRIRHTYRVREHLAAVLSWLKDAEADARGYVITGHEDYLAPYNGAIKAVERNLSDLRALSARNPTQRQRLDALRPLIAARLDALGRVIAVRREEGLAAAAKTMRADQGKQLMDQIRASLGDMKNAENALLRRQEDEARINTQRMVVTLAAGASVAFSILLLVFYFLNREIVERGRAEQALRVSEQRLRILVEGVRDYAIFMLDPKGQIASWNPGAERIMGYSAQEIIGRHFKLFYPSEDVEAGKPEAVLRSVEETGRYEEEGWRVRKGGKRFSASIVISALRDDDGRLRGFSKVTRDITERKRAEEALRESEARYRAVSELTSDYTYAFRVEPDGSVVIEWVAGAFTRITGYTPEEAEALGGGITLVHPDDFPAALRRLQTLVSGQSDTSEFRIITKSGDVRWVRETGRPAWDTAQGKLRVLGAAQDITERRQAEAEARHHQAELAHLLRVGTIGEMAAGLAHEINQPLSAIVSYAKGCARRIRGAPEPSAELLDALESIAAQAVRADQIVRRLRNFVRKQEPARERVDLNDLVRDVARLAVSETRHRRIKMRLDLASALPPIQVDGIQIEQVILNLIRNGLEAMHGPNFEDGVLSIRTSVSAEDTVEVAVCDSGEGLADEHADKMFDPFYTTKPHGLGMGLSISRSIIEAHGGRLWATPNQDRGATFRFTVPISGGDRADAA
jgi:two-component system, LuxR family, sensor kinase FixL